MGLWNTVLHETSYKTIHQDEHGNLIGNVDGFFDTDKLL